MWYNLLMRFAKRRSKFGVLMHHRCAGQPLLRELDSTLHVLLHDALTSLCQEVSQYATQINPSRSLRQAYACKTGPLLSQGESGGRCICSLFHLHDIERSSPSEDADDYEPKLAKKARTTKKAASKDVGTCSLTKKEIGDRVKGCLAIEKYEIPRTRMYVRILLLQYHFEARISSELTKETNS